MPIHLEKGGLPHEDLMETIFANRVATGKYTIGPANDDFIGTATSDVVADFDIERIIPQEAFKRKTDTYFTDHYFRLSGGSFPTWSRSLLTFVDIRLFAILDYVGLCYLKIRTSNYL
ncbi:hypothetical protein GIB67_025280 [Kingdonia uniflora]|uniref:Uncharacterized protein n=1 Tax=Kingdonia uniflora TaxID=39325 RepID=A0A7J7NBM4_9MAGN|nr:hypothetical protein GIB67_025280 [Kingdonia uniflora]